MLLIRRLLGRYADGVARRGPGRRSTLDAAAERVARELYNEHRFIPGLGYSTTLPTWDGLQPWQRKLWVLEARALIDEGADSALELARSDDGND